VYPAFFNRAGHEPADRVLLPAILSMISARVAPFLRWSMATTWAVLLPSRGPVSCVLAALLALGAFLAAVVFLVALAFFGAPLGALGAGVAASWAAVVVSGGRRRPVPGLAFQIRATALLRSVNFLTGFRPPANPATPAKPFQILDQAVGGPVGGELGKLLFAGELFLAFRNLLGGGEGGDGVVVVDAE